MENKLLENVPPLVTIKSHLDTMDSMVAMNARQAGLQNELHMITCSWPKSVVSDAEFGIL